MGGNGSAVDRREDAREHFTDACTIEFEDVGALRLDEGTKL